MRREAYQVRERETEKEQRTRGERTFEEQEEHFDIVCLEGLAEQSDEVKDETRADEAELEEEGDDEEEGGALAGLLPPVALVEPHHQALRDGEDEMRGGKRPRETHKHATQHTHTHTLSLSLSLHTLALPLERRESPPIISLARVRRMSTSRNSAPTSEPMRAERSVMRAARTAAYAWMERRP